MSLCFMISSPFKNRVIESLLQSGSMRHEVLDGLAFRGLLVRWRILTVATHPEIILIGLEYAQKNRAGLCLGLILGGRAPRKFRQSVSVYGMRAIYWKP